MDYAPIAGAAPLSSFAAPQSYTPYNSGGQTVMFFDPGAVTAFFNANPAKFVANATNAQASLQSDYTLTEDIKAAYAMGHYALDDLRLTAGIRYESTDLSTGSYNFTTIGKTTTPAYGQQVQHYHDWLPSAELDWNVTSKLRARAAFSRTLARPNYSDLAGRQTIAINSGTNFVTITSGNAQLQPRRSDNYDVSLEYYANRDVLFSVAGFIKNVRNEILTVSNTALQPYNGVMTQVTTTQPINASGTVIRGVELNAVVTRLSFLPPPLDGLGIAANVTLLNPTTPSVMMTNGTRRQLSSLVESANVVGNVRAFYTIGPVTVQGAWNHLAPLLLTVSTTDPTQDVRYKASDVFDAQVRVRLSRAITVVAQGKNLSDNRPTRVGCSRLIMTAWSWAAASCRGVSHVRSGTRKQDAMSCFCARGGSVLVAISSDGAGSASHGGEGASLVCRTMGSALRNHFAATATAPTSDQFWQWLDATRDRIALAAKRRGLIPRDFAATMMVAASAGHWTIAAHVGDGAVVARHKDGGWTALSWPEQGEYASTTFFVTDDAGPRLRLAAMERPIDAMAVFTDGIERLALDLARGEAHQPFFEGMIRPLESGMTAGPDRDLGVKLAMYLDSPAVCDRTDDDKTLILALRR